eukprot:SAG31_NODE_1755_length_7344_cov_7.207039_3_plen_42_part_00
MDAGDPGPQLHLGWHFVSPDGHSGCNFACRTSGPALQLLPL